VSTIDLRIVTTTVGEDEISQFLTGIVDDAGIAYFKLGEGGWSLSSLWTQTVGAPGFTQYDGTVDQRLPVARGEFELTDGVLSLKDPLGDGVLTGDGTGTINYRTGEYSASFSGIAIAPVQARYKYLGVPSALKTLELGYGRGNAGYYHGTIRERPVVPGTVTVYAEVFAGGLLTTQSVTDVPVAPYNGMGTFAGAGVGTINYETGEFIVEFAVSVDASRRMWSTYQYDYAPDAPSVGFTDLVAESVPNLFVIREDLSVVDFEDHGDGTVTVSVHLELWEGIDADGNGGIPYFFEGGLFAEKTTGPDIMLCYFTYPRLRKTGGTEIDLYPKVVI